jgi:cytochrome c oxidase subunit 3
MSDLASTSVRGGGAPRSKREIVPSSVLGMLIVAGTELMFFMGLISAFTISRAGVRAVDWQVPGTTLPAAATAFNTSALMASAVLVLVAWRQMSAKSAAASRTLFAAWVLGALFVGLQGREWVQLLSQGFTMHASRLGSFFYLIVGAHALHAAGALIALGVAWDRLRRGVLSDTFFLGAATFWYFVVGIWPVIYARVYF